MDRAIVAQLVRAVEAEVNNGGFDQFFFNSSSNHTAEIITALETIGASKTADIVKRAAAKFPGGMPPVEWTERQNLLVETVSPDADAFEELDLEFYRHPDDLKSLLKDYETA